MEPLQLWAGVEPTVQRIRDRYGNQLRRSHHWEHIEDLDLFAQYGVRVLRHPLLWELIAPTGLQSADWAWFDERFERMKQLGIRPIAGLVHHGSGPKDTSLVEDTFAPRLAAFARACAERYPWVEDYTPINEPLTTARFSALYGHWYPHARDPLAFIRALVNECRATVLAMQQIRAVNPRARLIQTDDIAVITARPPFQQAADFQNERRWLTFDLLLGRVDRTHPLWHWLQPGVSQAELEFFLEHPCAPDVIGLNYYITSDRTLDDRLDLYPPEYRGEDGGRPMADIESVRADAGVAGHERVLMDTWERYHLPLAITEVHLDSTREEQLRWIDEAWRSAKSAREKGADVRAITVWSLLGAFDWNSLLTEERGYYEPGAFDLRAPKPRPTAIAGMVRALAEHGHFHHPVLEGRGWWRRPQRKTHGFPAHDLLFDGRDEFGSDGMRPLIITGANGALGRACAHACEVRGLSHRLLTRQQLDIADADAVARVIEALSPWAIFNAAGFKRAHDSTLHAQRCLRENTLGAQTLAEAAGRRGVPLVTFSSDRVFNGEKGHPYVESDPLTPLDVYGFTQAEAERRVRLACEQSLIIRSSGFFGPWQLPDTLTGAARPLAWGAPKVLRANHLVSPTYLPDLVRVTLDLLIDEAWGVWHLTNVGMISWADLGRRVAQRLSGAAVQVEGPGDQEAGRPRCLALVSERAALMPTLDDALERYHDELQLRSAQ